MNAVPIRHADYFSRKDAATRDIFYVADVFARCRAAAQC